MARLQTQLFAYGDFGQGFSMAWQDANDWGADKRVRIERPNLNPNTLILREYNSSGVQIYTETALLNGTTATFNPPNSQPGGDTFDINVLADRAPYTFSEGTANRWLTPTVGPTPGPTPVGFGSGYRFTDKNNQVIELSQLLSVIGQTDQIVVEQLSATEIKISLSQDLTFDSLVVNGDARIVGNTNMEGNALVQGDADFAGDTNVNGVLTSGTLVVPIVNDGQTPPTRPGSVFIDARTQNVNVVTA